MLMSAGRNNFGFLVKKIGSCMLEDFEFFTHAKCTFTIRGVESGILLYGPPRNVVRSTEVLDVPYFFRQASVRFVFDDVEGFLVIFVRPQQENSRRERAVSQRTLQLPAT